MSTGEYRYDTRHHEDRFRIFFRGFLSIKRSVKPVKYRVVAESQPVQISGIPVIERPREKIQKRGASVLTDRELIAAIIGKGVHGHSVLSVATVVEEQLKRDFPELNYSTLAKIPGIGHVKACQLLACFELARRYIEEQPVRIQRPEDVLPLLPDLREEKQEHFISITMNGAGEMIKVRTITVGLLNQSQIHPREAFADAITDRAASVIFVHNHPSGSLLPSEQDRAVTRQLVEAGRILGIAVLDHLIISKKGFLSMKQHGLI
jgi:DNA repair protein RadC